MTEYLTIASQVIIVLLFVYHFYLGFDAYKHRDLRNEIHHYAWAIMFLVAGVVL